MTAADVAGRYTHGDGSDSDKAAARDGGSVLSSAVLSSAHSQSQLSGWHMSCHAAVEGRICQLTSGQCNAGTDSTLHSLRSHTAIQHRHHLLLSYYRHNGTGTTMVQSSLLP